MIGVPIAGTIIDRFLHHAHVIAITGKSYRVKEAPVITQENARFLPRIGYNDYRMSVPIDFLTSILMAQVCGGTTFDFVARRKHEVAQKVMSRAPDIWAAGGREALNVDSVIAVILRIFLARWSEYGGLRQEVRTLERWLPLVGTAEEEADALVSQVAPAKNAADVLSQLSAEISSAAEQWSLGNPEEPPTAHALNAVAYILFSHKLVHRPPNPKLPTTVCRDEKTRKD